LRFRAPLNYQRYPKKSSSTFQFYNQDDENVKNGIITLN
jgi:hypothetical protein